MARDRIILTLDELCKLMIVWQHRHGGRVGERFTDADMWGALEEIGFTKGDMIVDPDEQPPGDWES